LTESPRHANTVQRIKDLLLELEAKIWENNSERGILGWKLPAIMTEDGFIVQYTLDVFARLKTGAVVAVEIDYHYKTTPVAEGKKHRRDGHLMRFGIVTIRLTPKMVDGMTASQLQEEIDYWLLGKRPLEAMT